MAASAMPLVIGITSILGAFFILYLITLFTDVSIFALNQTTGLGLGLGIDYALLIVNRFREELHHGKDVETSVVNTLATAGKTVFYSGLTVMITLISLMFFPQYFLKSMGYAGVAVVALAVAGALIPLPAILALMGKRIDFGVLRKSAITPKEDGRWADIARTVMTARVMAVPNDFSAVALSCARISAETSSGASSASRATTRTGSPRRPARRYATSEGSSPARLPMKRFAEYIVFSGSTARIRCAARPTMGAPLFGK